MVFQDILKGVSRKSLGYFKEVLRVFTEGFKGVSRKLKGFQEVLGKFQEYFKKISRMFQGRLSVGLEVLDWCLRQCYEAINC